ncbi:hypothetical protein VNO80_07433 [Phaseolus coccineus]|uniref:Uncharacterized protein n=1 Tax=Phaseolus coccineus TaxID=3886 RepID=A0AAN9NIZ0_PHACN
MSRVEGGKRSGEEEKDLLLKELILSSSLIMQLYLTGEKFNQPIFHCNNLFGHVEPVVANDQHRALYSTHSFKIIFKEGGCGTFIPLFFNLTASVRQYQHYNMHAQSYMDPLQAAQTPINELMRHVSNEPPEQLYASQLS